MTIIATKKPESLSLIRVSKRFGNCAALEDVCVDLPTGVIGVLGPNGCGKSTMLRLLAGLVDPDEGQVQTGGVEIDLHSSSWRNRIGYLPQTPGLYERMTAYEFLDYALLLSGWKNRRQRSERCEETLSSLNLLQYRRIPLGHLSGGTRQRVALGQAIVHEPDILLLDEPTNNLDTEERARFHRLLSRRADVGITLVVGHIINEMHAICSKLIVLCEGKVAFQGYADQLIDAARGVVKEICVPLKALHDLERAPSLHILSRFMHDTELTLRFDSRFNNVSGAVDVEPTLEEAYRVALR